MLETLIGLLVEQWTVACVVAVWQERFGELLVRIGGYIRDQRCENEC